MAKYIKCEYCGKKIHFGEVAFVVDDGDYGHPYCSENCVAQDISGPVSLDTEQAKYWGFDVYDDDAKRKKLESEIAKLQAELNRLNQN